MQRCGSKNKSIFDCKILWFESEKAESGMKNPRFQPFFVKSNDAEAVL